MDSEADCGFDTPEEAALSGWDAAAKPKVVKVIRDRADRVYVVVDTEPSHPMRVQCERRDGRWEWVSDITA